MIGLWSLSWVWLGALVQGLDGVLLLLSPFCFVHIQCPSALGGTAFRVPLWHWRPESYQTARMLVSWSRAFQNFLRLLGCVAPPSHHYYPCNKRGDLGTHGDTGGILTLREKYTTCKSRRETSEATSLLLSWSSTSDSQKHEKIHSSCVTHSTCHFIVVAWEKHYSLSLS